MVKKILKTACSALLMTVIMAGTASPALAETKIPERPEGYVCDMAGVLSDSENAVLNEQLEAHSQKEKTRIDVLTVKSTGGESIRSLAGRVEAAWRTGVITSGSQQKKTAQKEKKQSDAAKKDKEDFDRMTTLVFGEMVFLFLAGFGFRLAAGFSLAENRNVVYFIFSVACIIVASLIATKIYEIAGLI